MAAISRAVGPLMVALVCGACGGSSDHDDPQASAGGSSGASGSSSTGGKSSTGGSSGGDQSSAGAPAAGTGGTGGTGGSSTGPIEETGPGTVTDLWRDFCVATFTEDYMVQDPFGEPVFTAKAGEEYLLIEYPSPFGWASLEYLTSSGPYEFDVDPDADTMSFPFTSNCALDPPVSYMAVFADISVYAEPELVTKLCDLQAGATVLYDGAGNAGYAINSNSADGAIYQLFLNAFAAECGGADTGYINVPRVRLFGIDHILVPFDMIQAEN